MSFYYDDDEQSDIDNEESFQCITCGSTDYYVESGGALCCTSCFTQSQQMTQESTELDVDEVQALAARTSTGRVLNRTPKKIGAAATKQERKPLDEYDKSTPFPNLITCIHGIQEVLKYCIEPLCNLVGLEDEMEQVKRTVQKLWMSYMRAWTDGAEFYGKLHPEIRFSFRDCFLPSTYKTKVMKHLSHKAAQTVQTELDILKEEEKKDDSMIIEADTSTSVMAIMGSDDSDDDSGDNEDSEDLSLPKRHQETIQYFAPTYHKNPNALMWMYWHYGKRGRLEAALIIPPSMKLVACLLWLAVSRAGVTLNHVLRWMANGALPLQNAFAHCLLEQEQKALIHIASFFRISKLPTLNEMENTVDKLIVACGLKSFSMLHGLPPTAMRIPEPLETTTDTATAKIPTTDEIKNRPDFSYVTPRSAPLLTARLIGDLGFGKEVLYRSLALMGILKEPPQDLWLPAPLLGALPKNVATTAQVLAVIAVACRMTPGWETWVYPGPFGKAMKTGSVEKVSNRQQAEAESSRFVPYNEDSVQLLRNGPLVEGYLDYLEDIVLDEGEAIYPQFRSTLQSQSLEATLANSATETEKTAIAVQKPQAMKKSRNPLHPERIWRRQKLHDWKLAVRRKRARWADANGLGEYLIYEDPLSHVEDRKRIGLRRNPTPEPFHPQYGLLIEYMSYVSNVKASKIHAAITVLDDEVLRMMRPPENTKKRRKNIQRDFDNGYRTNILVGRYTSRRKC